MKNGMTNGELDVALTKLEQVEISERQRVVAAFAEKPEEFCPKFFSEIVTRRWDPACTWYAIRSIGDLRAKEYGHILLDVLRQPDISTGESSLHRICARSIGLLGHEMVRDVEILLQNSREETRIAAADALGESGHPSAISALSQCLISGERNLILWAALSLAKIGIKSIPTLSDALSKVRKEEALIILDAFMKIDSPQVIEAIAEMVETHREVLLFYFSKAGSRNTENFLKKIHDIPQTSPIRTKGDKILSLIKENQACPFKKMR